MKNSALWVIVILVVVGMMMFAGFLVMVAAVAKAGNPHEDMSGDDRIGVVEVVGEIRDSKKTLKQLRAFEEDAHVKAIVLRVDSPGGAVGPSQEIFDAIRRINPKKKIVTSMGSLAASGGYYIAAGTERIFANAGTLTGSIGVIMQIPNVEGLLKWAGVSMNTITSGKMKDSASMFRQMREDERQYFEGMLSDVHNQFIEAVALGRKMKVEDVKPLADGRVYSGRQALNVKLVDELGGIDAAISAAGKMSGLGTTPKVDYARKPRKFVDMIFNEDEEAESMWSQAFEKVLLRRSAPTPAFQFGAQ